MIGVTSIGLETYNPVQAQPASPPIFENVSIGSNFSPNPLIVRGIGGGSVPAEKVAGRAETANGPCVGFVDAQADHTLVLKDFFKYLSLQLQSPEDTTIIVRGPGGSWCNDDSQGKNAGITGEWLAGCISQNTLAPHVSLLFVRHYLRERWHASRLEAVPSGLARKNAISASRRVSDRFSPVAKPLVARSL